jgi:molybdopterin-guanine dinucleotide biosynthesis protein A
VAAAILAGGRARRLDGIDKSRLIVEGRSIIVRQLEALRRLTPQVFLVASDAERFADLGVPLVPDAQPGAGALGGLYTALISARADWIVVIACDMPFITSTALDQLVTEAAAADADGAWARSARGVEPLFACYRTTAAPRLRALVDAGERRLAAAGNVLTMREVDVDARVLTNVNTPEDYARVQ